MISSGRSFRGYAPEIESDDYTEQLDRIETELRDRMRATLDERKLLSCTRACCTRCAPCVDVPPPPLSERGKPS